MALYIPHSIFHLARLLYVRPETFGPYYVHRKYFGILALNLRPSSYRITKSNNTFSFFALKCAISVLANSFETLFAVR